ncbi:MAG: MDR family MFS transporter [Candidatus Bilamarchaeaceae archaeon]
MNLGVTKDNLRWWILLTVIIGTFLGRLDQTIVNLALPKIMDDFGITVSEAGWIATAYILANAVFVPIWGKLGDTIGRKKVYILGFTIFIIGSILAGLAWNLDSMILFRVIQAVAGSADYPTAMAIIAVTFKEGRERAEALGIWSSAFAASAVFGPLIGGPLIDNFGWRSIFLINLPIGIIGLLMAMRFVSESVSEKKSAHFDWWGAIALGISLCALVLVLDKGLDWGWTSPAAFACYGVCLIFGALFYRIESTCEEPIIDLKFFSHSAFVSTLINNFIVFMGMMGGLFLVPTFAEMFLGYSATETGYLFMPVAFGMVLAAPLGAKLIGRVDPNYVIAISTFVASIGLFMFLGLDIRSSSLDIVIPLLVMAIGLGFGMSQRTSIIASTVPTEEVGSASSTLALARNIAGAFGIAVFATILKDATEGNVLAMASNSVINNLSPAVLKIAVPLMMVKAQVDAYHTVFLWAGVLLLVGAILALTIRVKETKTGEEVFID